MGKLGGVELNYSSDIDLIFLYDADGTTDGPRPIANSEFFDRLARDVVRLLTEPTDLGICLPRRPAAAAGRGARAGGDQPRKRDALLRRARPHLGAAGVRQGPARGRRSRTGPANFSSSSSPGFIAATSAGPTSRASRPSNAASSSAREREGADDRNVKTGRGGIRDIEFVIQFLQLLNGGDLPPLRTGNTLDAIAQLEDAGCLTHQERTLLEENYSFLRKIEHRLQIMFDLQTHMHARTTGRTAQAGDSHGLRRRGRIRRRWTRFEADYKQKTELNRKILDHLLHDAFGDDDQTGAGSRPGARSRSAARADRRSAGPVSVSRHVTRPIRT